ncbi:MAG: hypothetical protein CL816_03335 [Coxiellaceae bacterium]|nr:hypothetical protein [Coxiellaceae bacterium]|tara:strand:+ start:3628 stop:4914 length:1287 start_codon:yes stop_codon:yes gene_type:complete
MTVTHRTLGVLSEGSFGSLTPSTGLPDKSGSYTSIPCERDPIIIFGEPVFSERNDARDGNFLIPPEPDTVFSGGSRVRHRTGQVVCRVDLTTIGTASADYSANYLGLLLGAGFKTRIPSVSTDNVTAVDVNSYTPSSGPNNDDVGTIIGADLSGRAEYSAITDDTNGGNVNFSPAFSGGFTGSKVIRHLQTWYVPGQNATGTRENSLSFRVDGVGFRTYCFGCVLESLSITLDNGRLMGEFTYQSAHIEDDHGNASGPIEPTYNSGSPPFFRGAYAVLSSTAPTSLTAVTTGNMLARTTADCEDFSLTVTNTLTPMGHSNSILAMSDMEISDVVVELTMTLSTPLTLINDDFFNRTLRQVVIGTGPIGDGLGCAIMLPAAQLAVDPSAYDVSGNDIVRQQLTYNQSRFSGDVSGSNATNSPFRLGLGI